MQASKCRVCGGSKSPTAVTRKCPNPDCEWHECDAPPVFHAENLTCPDCGTEW